MLGSNSGSALCKSLSWWCNLSKRQLHAGYMDTRLAPAGRTGHRMGLRQTWSMYAFGSVNDMIKEDNVGDTNQLYLALHGVDRLLSENCKMGLKSGSFYAMKDKEEGRDKQKISDWLEPHGHPCWRWKGPEMARGLGTDWQDSLRFWSQGHQRIWKRSKFWFADVHLGQDWLPLGPRNFFSTVFLHPLPLLHGTI